VTNDNESICKAAIDFVPLASISALTLLGDLGRDRHLQYWGMDVQCGIGLVDDGFEF